MWFFSSGTEFPSLELCVFFPLSQFLAVDLAKETEHFKTPGMGELDKVQSAIKSYYYIRKSECAPKFSEFAPNRSCHDKSSNDYNIPS